MTAASRNVTQCYLLCSRKSILESFEFGHPGLWVCVGRITSSSGKRLGDLLRHIMVELAWLWVRHQPDRALSVWFRGHVGEERGRVRRIAIVALARKLLIALWRYVTHGEVPEGAMLKAA